MIKYKKKTTGNQQAEFFFIKMKYLTNSKVKDIYTTEKCERENN